MLFYDFNKDVYNKVVRIVKFQFYKEIKNTGIVFKEIISAKNLVDNTSFYILRYEIDSRTKQLRFKDTKSFVKQLKDVAKQRLKKLEQEESILMRITDTESYGESKYFNDTEMNAINLSSTIALFTLLNNTTKSL
ncbi:uncharacterized protein DUF1104 [Mangrovibacterium diazotrophicum]|uniref:Uncharacterized protein DUF1104 n=1 Tax=Mangrovibacterium diazotrophicum TaxID=1261403 RepID=A0A419WAB9_9BACT|nr:uncharacterized protein DUF1104 [Mangrovibacterium diazotrophicum]